MPKSRPPYTPEFRRQMVQLMRGGRRPEVLSREFDPTAQAIRNWVEQADLDEGLRSDGLTTAERAELRRLRRENRQLYEKRENSEESRGLARLARETETVPNVHAGLLGLADWCPLRQRSRDGGGSAIQPAARQGGLGDGRGQVRPSTYTPDASPERTAATPAGTYRAVCARRGVLDASDT
jgi:transposase